MVCVAALCSALGAWQVCRLGQKNSAQLLIDRGFYETPIPIKKMLHNPVLEKKTEYRPVILTGYYNEHLSLKWMAKVQDGENGFYVLTPLELSDGTMVLINRGWSKNPSVLTAGRGPKTPVFLTGYIRFPGTLSVFTPDNQLKRGEVYGLTLPEIRDFWSRGMGKNMPLRTDFYVVLMNPIQLDKGISPLKGRPVLRNTHLSYAITWYLLALVFSAMTLIYLVQNRRVFKP